MKGTNLTKTLILALILVTSLGLLTPHCRTYDLCEVTDRESLVELLKEIHDTCINDVDGR